jgi:hypothetical protein
MTISESAKQVLPALLSKHRFGGELRKKKNRVELRFDDLVPIFRFFVQHTAAQ